MPKTEGDEVMYRYVPDYSSRYVFFEDEDDEDAVANEPGGAPGYDAFVALTTKSRYQVVIPMLPDLVRTLGVEQVAQEVASDVDELMNMRLNGPEYSPELGVQIDRDKIRAALEAGISRT